MKTIKPLILDKQNIIAIANDINEYIKETFFSRLVNIYKEETKIDLYKNALSNLIIEAIKSNKLYIENNYIKGNFNSKLIKELEKAGGKYRKNRGFYFETLPLEVTNYINQNTYKVKQLYNRVDNLINNYLENINDSLKFLDINYNNTLDNYKKQLEVNLSKFSIKPVLSEYEDNYINNNYILDTKKSIKGFLELDLNQLRNKIKDYVLNDGYSYKYIADAIQHNYSLSQKRATFIARQESSLLLAEYNKAKMTKLGLNKYIWSTAKDEKVRHDPNGEDHKILDGQVFSYDNPPYVDKTRGIRANPGERFNCRCLSIPLIE